MIWVTDIIKMNIAVQGFAILLIIWHALYSYSSFGPETGYVM